MICDLWRETKLCVKNSVMDLSMDQRLAIKFCFKAGKSATESLQMVNTAYGDQPLSRSNVFRWYGLFRDGREDTEDDTRSGRPTECRIDNNVEKIFSVVVSKPSPFAKNVGGRGEHWQGHGEKGCN